MSTMSIPGYSGESQTSDNDEKCRERRKWERSWKLGLRFLGEGDGEGIVGEETIRRFFCLFCCFCFLLVEPKTHSYNVEIPCDELRCSDLGEDSSRKQLWRTLCPGSIQPAASKKNVRNKLWHFENVDGKVGKIVQEKACHSVANGNLIKWTKRIEKIKLTLKAFSGRLLALFCVSGWRVQLSFHRLQSSPMHNRKGALQ